MKRVGDQFEPISWAEALETVAKKFNEVQGARREIRRDRFQSHHQRRELLSCRSSRAQGLGTSNIDHHRTGDVATLLDALSGRSQALATVGDLYTAKAVLVVANDLSQQHPLLAFQIRADKRHHSAHIYVVTPGPVREDKYAVKSVRAAEGAEIQALEGLRDALQGRGRFGDPFR